MNCLLQLSDRIATALSKSLEKRFSNFQVVYIRRGISKPISHGTSDPLGTTLIAFPVSFSGVFTARDKSTSGKCDINDRRWRHRHRLKESCRIKMSPPSPDCDSMQSLVWLRTLRIFIAQ